VRLPGFFLSGVNRRTACYVAVYMSSATDAVIAANRFGLGAKPGELLALASGARDALDAQLHGPVQQPAATLQSSAQILTALATARRQQRQARQSDAAPDVVAVALNLGQMLRPLYVADCVARLQLAVTSERSFVERLVHFWSNHFAVSVDKLQVLGLAGAMEREAIRPNVLGNFAQMLQAVEQHPAMLLYLDNVASTGPQSIAAQRLRGRAAIRVPGLNENLGREILELHTLGVDGGYSQRDVTTLAAMITGWSVEGGDGVLADAETGRFRFREVLHEPGAKSLLGRTYYQDGVEQGQRALHDLALHPRTAHHLATKLVRHFAGDEPAPSVVQHVAAAYLKADGDLPSTYRALLACHEVWEPQLSKFKTPADYIHSIWRALALPIADNARALAPFDQLGQRLFAPGSPAGWPDISAGWDGSSSLLKRIELVHGVAQRSASRVDALALAEASLGPSLSPATRTAIARAQDGVQGITLLFASPEFMRR